ncbi:MAG: hypothetical protein KGZ85_14265 [Ignavibacterium sp.]|nr:hypothetical protein [Ignavibacterium sp.]
MKQLVVLLSIFTVIFFFGCQENQITEPINSLDKTSGLINGGVINLDSPVFDPLSGKCAVSGVVKYKIYRPLANEEPMTASKKVERVKLIIAMDAVLVDLLNTQPHERWLIKGTTEHQVVFFQDDIKPIQLKYEITGRDDIILIVKYNFERYSLSLQQMYLVRKRVVALS